MALKVTVQGQTHEQSQSVTIQALDESQMELLVSSHGHEQTQTFTRVD